MESVTSTTSIESEPIPGIPDIKYRYDPFGACGPTYELARLHDYLRSNNKLANFDASQVKVMGYDLSTYEIWKDWLMSFFIKTRDYFITIRGLDKEAFTFLSNKFPNAGLFPSVWVPIG